MSFTRKRKRKNKGSKKRRQFLYNPNNPKKSFNVYIDKNPKDTIPIKYKSLEELCRQKINRVKPSFENLKAEDLMSKPEPKIDMKEEHVDLPNIKLPIEIQFTNKTAGPVFYEGKEIKSGERIVMTKPSVEPVSIWKDVSELQRYLDGAAVFYKRDGQTFIGEAHTFNGIAIYPDSNSDHLENEDIDKVCLVSDLINSFEQMQKDRGA
jgi:hypothetical protein